MVAGGTPRVVIIVGASVLVVVVVVLLVLVVVVVVVVVAGLVVLVRVVMPLPKHSPHCGQTDRTAAPVALSVSAAQYAALRLPCAYVAHPPKCDLNVSWLPVHCLVVVVVVVAVVVVAVAVVVVVVVVVVVAVVVVEVHTPHKTGHASFTTSRSQSSVLNALPHNLLSRTP